MSSLHITEKEVQERLRSTAAAKKKSRQRRFKPQWVKFPVRWVEQLRKSKNASTYQLVLTILLEAFKREQLGGEIILSMKTTGMPRSTRARETFEVKAGAPSFVDWRTRWYPGRPHPGSSAS